MHGLNQRWEAPPSVGRAQQGRTGGRGASTYFACGPTGGVASLQGDRSAVEPPTHVPPPPALPRGHPQAPLHRSEGRGFGGRALEGSSPARECRGSAAHSPHGPCAGRASRCRGGRRGRAGRRDAASVGRGVSADGAPAVQAPPPALRRERDYPAVPPWQRRGLGGGGARAPAVRRARDAAGRGVGVLRTCARLWTCPTGERAGTRSGWWWSMPTWPSTSCAGTRSKCARTPPPIRLFRSRSRR